MTAVAPLPSAILEPLVRMALAEDLGRAGDITGNATVPEQARARVVIAAREEGRIAGLDLAEMAFRLVDAALDVKRLMPEGAGHPSGGSQSSQVHHGTAQLQDAYEPQGWQWERPTTAGRPRTAPAELLSPPPTEVHARCDCARRVPPLIFGA